MLKQQFEIWICLNMVVSALGSDHGFFAHCRNARCSISNWICCAILQETDSYPTGSMYGIYANIWGILMVNVTIYSIHGSYEY